MRIICFILEYYYNSFSYFLSLVMRNYQAILTQFEKQGVYETNQVTFHEVKRALDSISAQNTGNYQFNHQIADQIWGETSNRLGGTPVTLKQYINTMLHAQQILRDETANLQQQLRLQQSENQKQQILNQLFSLSQDHRILTTPFGISQLNNSKELQSSKRYSSFVGGVGGDSVRYSRSKLFTDEPDQRERSTDMVVIFYLSVLWGLIEFIMLFHKHHFFNLLVISLIVSMFVLKYFDKQYVVILLTTLGVSCALDFIWLIVLASVYWDPGAETQHSTLQGGFLKAVVFFTCVAILIRLILIGLLFKYKSVDENVKKKLSVLGVQLVMDARADPHNLVLKSLKPQNQTINGYEPSGI